MPVRPAAVAGTWYPGTAGALTRDVDGYLDDAPRDRRADAPRVIAPHAGLMFSGPVGAYAYKPPARRPLRRRRARRPVALRRVRRRALYPEGAFESPLGRRASTRTLAARDAGRARSFSACRRRTSASIRSRCSCRFCGGCSADVPIVPLLMGYQTRETIAALADGAGARLRGRRALLVASTDLSHYFDAATAATLDGRVQDARRGVRSRRPARAVRAVSGSTSADATSPAAAGRRSR